MAINNPYIPGDPFSYDLKWIVAKIKEILQQLGTLDEVIDQKIFEGFLEHSIVQFKNVPDMLSADITDGSIVLTLGYYEEGDQGGTFYLVKDFNPGQCALDYFLTMDNNAQIAIPVIVTPYVMPEMFGAKGDGTTDDTEALQHAADYAAAMEADLTTADRTYYITDTVTIDGTNVKNIRLDGVIKLGMNDKPGVKFINCTRNQIRVEVSGTEYNGGYNTVPTNFNIPVLPFVGALFENAEKCEIYVSAENCNVGARFSGDAGSCVFNTVTLGMMVNNAINLELYSNNNGWTNDNMFLNGNFSCWSDNTFRTYHVDVFQRSVDGTHEANNNVFIKPSFEGGGLPIYLKKASFNQFNYMRCENGTAYYAKVDDGRDNVFSGGYGLVVPGQLDHSDNPRQIFKNIKSQQLMDLVLLHKWEFERHENFFLKDPTGTYWTKSIKGLDMFRQGWTDPQDTYYGIATPGSPEEDGISTNTGQVYGFYVDVTNIDTLYSRMINASGGDTGRFAFRFFDSSFNTILPTIGTEVKTDSNFSFYYQDDHLVTSSTYAGLFMPLYLNSASIKYVFVGVQYFSTLSAIEVYTTVTSTGENPGGRVFTRQPRLGEIEIPANGIKANTYKGRIIPNAPQTANGDGSYNFAYVCTDATNNTWTALKSGV